VGFKQRERRDSQMTPSPNRLRRRRAPAALAIAFALGLGGCAGDSTGLGVNLVPQEQVQAMGVEAWNAIRQQTPASNNSGYQQTAQRVGNAILRGAGYDPSTWEIVVFQGDEVNAFALPGRKIGVYEGMFGVADTPDQLAAVIGHEVAHVEAHHAAERANTEVGTQLGTQIIGAALGAAGVAPPETITQVLGLGAQYGVALPYGRNQELEADRLGLHYMANAGYDPDAAVRVWQQMATLGGQPPEFLSTHPSPERRIAALQQEAAQIKGR